MMKKLAAVIVLTISLSALCIAAGSIPYSHRQIISQVVDSLFRNITADSRMLSAGSVALKMNDEPQNNYLQQQVVQSLVAHNIIVLLAPSNVDTVFECSVKELSLQYGDVFTESFFGERKVERQLKVSIDVTMISSGTGKVLFSQNLTRSSIDTVSYAMTNQLQDHSLPFTHTVEPHLSFFDSILEPAIVTIASGIVVYLFFTIRS